MADFLRPDPVLVAFIFVTQFVACAVLFGFALLRLAGGRGGRTRSMAFLCALGCVALIWTTYAGALEMTDHPAYAPLRHIQAWQGGAPAVLGLSAVLWLSAFMPGVRWRWIDGLHGMAILAYLGLWGYVNWS